jgi:hypothetical protein
MRLAVAVIVRSGLSTRPAISQPNPSEATAMMPSAIPDSISSRFSVSVRSPTAACWIAISQGLGWPGGSGFGSQSVSGGGAAAEPAVSGPAASHTSIIAVPMSASVTIGAIVLAVLLAIAGGLLAGSFGGWRAARLRLAAALARVA